MVHSSVNRIQFYRCNDVKTCLFKTKRHASGTGKKVYHCWSITHDFSNNLGYLDKSDLVFVTGHDTIDVTAGVRL